MKVRDPFFGEDSLRAIPGVLHAAGTVNGDWIDTYLWDHPIAFVAEISFVAAEASVEFTMEMAPDDGSDAPDTGKVTDLPEDLCVLPKHTSALPNEPPVLGSFPAVQTAVTTATAPLRWYIDPLRAGGEVDGMQRWIRVKADVAVDNVTFGVMAERCRPYAGIVAP